MSIQAIKPFLTYVYDSVKNYRRIGGLENNFVFDSS